MPTLQQLETKRERLKTNSLRSAICGPVPWWGRFRKCGKVSCHCAQPGFPKPTAQAGLSPEP